MKENTSMPSVSMSLTNEREIVIVDREEFEQWLKVIEDAPYIALDTEGFAEDKNQWIISSNTLGFGVAEDSYQGYFPIGHIKETTGNLDPSWMPQLQEVIETHPRWIAHNAKHDLKALEKLGWKMGPFYCSLLMTSWIDENLPSKALDYVSKMFGGEGKKRPPQMQAIIDVFGWEYIPIDMIAPYSAQDARASFDIFKTELPEFQAQGFDMGLWDVEQNFIRLVNRMEWNGIRIDTELSQREAEKGERIQEEIRNQLGFNPNSPKDMSRILLDELGYPVKKRTEKGKPSFDKQAMERYDELLEKDGSNLAQLVRRYRGWAKTTATNYRAYLELLSPDGRLRPNYNLHRAVTGRSSCSDPNLQNIPQVSDKEWDGNLKAAFIAEDEFELIDFDYKNLELRLMAAYGKQVNLIAILDDPNRDIFEEVSHVVDLSRFDTKTLHYLMGYGGGIDKIKSTFDKDYPSAKIIFDNFWKNYSGIKKVSDGAAVVAREQGYITYWSGRRRHLTKEEEFRLAFNSAIQGGAWEIVKRAGLRTQQFESPLSRMLLTVHDSWVWEIHKSIKDKIVPEIKRELERVPEADEFGVSFFVDVKKWGE